MTGRATAVMLMALATCMTGCGRTDTRGNDDAAALAPADAGTAPAASATAATAATATTPSPILAQTVTAVEDAPIPTFDANTGPVVSQVDLTAPAIQTPNPEADVADASAAPTLAGGVTPGQVCAAAMGMLTGVSPASVSVRSGDTAQPRVALIRPDGANQVFDCRITGRSVLWRPVDATGFGRWRDDDAITFTADERGLAMTADGVTRAFARP